MLIEWQLDQDFTRFALVAAFPLWFCVSLVSYSERYSQQSDDLSILGCSSVLLHANLPKSLYGCRTYRSLPRELSLLLRYQT